MSEFRQQERIERELRGNPALAKHILLTLPPASTELEKVIVRVAPNELDHGIARALALAAGGVMAQLELVGDEN